MAKVAQTGVLPDARLMRYDTHITADHLDRVGCLFGNMRLPYLVPTSEDPRPSMVDDFPINRYC